MNQAMNDRNRREFRCHHCGQPIAWCQTYPDRRNSHWAHVIQVFNGRSHSVENALMNQRSELGHAKKTTHTHERKHMNDSQAQVAQSAKLAKEACKAKEPCVSLETYTAAIDALTRRTMTITNQTQRELRNLQAQMILRRASPGYGKARLPDLPPPLLDPSDRSLRAVWQGFRGRELWTALAAFLWLLLMWLVWCFGHLETRTGPEGGGQGFIEHRGKAGHGGMVEQMRKGGETR